MRGTADDQRRARLVHEDRIDFINEREVELALHEILDLPRHVVAQVVEADFVVGDVRDVAGVRRTALGGRQAVLDDADGESQRFVQRAHPLRVAPREVVVDRHHVNAALLERAHVDGQRRDERLALAGLHFGDASLEQHLTAHNLHVEMPHAERALAGLAHDGERLGNDRVERFVLVETLAELLGLRAQLFVGERRDRRFERIRQRGGAAKFRYIPFVRVEKRL